MAEQFDKGVFVRACQKVLKELEDYKGEEIVKGRHPLHCAIVNLEQLCRKQRGSSWSGQQYALVNPLDLIWYMLVTRSRGTDRVFQFTQFPEIKRLIPDYVRGGKSSALVQLADLLAMGICMQMRLVELAERGHGRGLQYKIQQDAKE